MNTKVGVAIVANPALRVKYNLGDHLLLAASNGERTVFPGQLKK
jgi:hypothetical protein